MNYWPRWIGSIQKKTSHLSLAEMGAYDRLLDHYYANEAPLPADLDRCCRICGATTKAERASVAAVLAEFFTMTEAGHTNDRAAEEVLLAQARAEAARANGLLGGRPKKNPTETQRVPPGNPAETQNESSTTSNSSLVPSEPRNPLPTVEGSGAAQRAAPPPPPPFDGRNAEVLNGKAVVPIAAGFSLPAPWGLDAEALGFPPPAIAREGEKFRQYWTEGKGKGKRRSVKGWRQSWSNWLEKAARDQR